MIVLFRDDPVSHEELPYCLKHNMTALGRSEVPANSLVVGRYSVLPFYEELEKDLAYKNSYLINSYSQHSYIADFFYYSDIRHLTFTSWTEDQFPYCKYDGPFVVKGATNSRKRDWANSMFAPTKQDAIKIGIELAKDSLIGFQKIIYRQYIKLKELEVGIKGLPFAAEWRFFFFKNEILGADYYWSSAQNVDVPVPPGATEIAREAARILSDEVDFFVVDVAEKDAGGFVVVEINDAQMSGLSCIDPDSFYYNLNKAIK